MQPKCLRSTGRRWRVSVTCARLALRTCHARMLSRAASPARTSATPAAAQALPASAQDFGANTPESFASYDQDTCLWRTLQLSFLEELTRFSETWPRSGTMRNGSVYQRRPLVRLTDVTGSSLWPTPVAHDDNKTPEAHMAMKQRMPGGPRQTISSLNVMVKAIEQGKFPHLWPTLRSSDADRGGRGDLIQAVRGNPNSHYKMYPTPTVPNGGRSPRGGMSLTGMTPDGKKRQVDLAHFVRQSDGVSGQLNPTWVEWLMGFPIGWTDLKDSETP